MNQPIQGSLEYWAQIKPNETAIVDENGYELTWKEWNRQADLLADAFERAGLRANDIVAVRSQIRTEWFVVNRALAKIGCMQIGLNWHFTLPEILHVMKDSGACAVVFDDPAPDVLLPLWDEIPLKTMVGINTTPHPEVEQYEKMISEREVQPRISKAIKPELIIYTSGTTGHPKGVYKDPALAMKNLNVLLEYQQDMLESSGFMKTGNISLVNTPLHHGLGPHNAEITHKSGGKVVLLKKFDPEKTLELIMKHKITRWTSVPTLLKRIAQLPKDVLNKYDVSSVVTLSVGAAPVPYSLKEWAMDYFGEHCVYEGYGSSEAGLISILQPELQRKKPGSCGYPYKHVQIEIRDEDGQKLNAGEVGVIWVKTPVCIDRYLNKEKLGPDTLDENGFFQTGDMGYLDDEGYLYISDRIKDMIISGGVNIYPAEIEAVIQKHPAVQDVAVIGIPDEEFGEQIKAFCEINGNVSVTEEELIEYCRGQLASYKRPRSIEFIDELPRNTVGKITKNELRKAYWKERERNV